MEEAQHNTHTRCMHQNLDIVETVHPRTLKKLNNFP